MVLPESMHCNRCSSMVYTWSNLTRNASLEKILKHSVGFLLFATICCHNSSAENIPFNPIPASDYSASNNVDGYVRLKVSVAADETTQAPRLKYANVVVCSKTDCYRLTKIQGSEDKTTDGTVLIADIMVPPARIEKIYFEELRGGNFYGAMKLSSDLNIEKGYYGGEILVIVKSTQVGDKAIYRPIYATSGLMRENGRSIYYNPKFPLTVGLDHGVVLKLPSQALSRPQIFNAKIHDTGNDFPLVDIYPYVNLTKNASLSVRAIQRTSSKNIPSEMPAPKLPPPFMPNGQRAGPMISSVGIGMGSIFPIEKIVPRMGLFRSSEFERESAGLATPSNTASDGMVTTAAVQYTCNDYLSYPPNMQIIKDFTAQTGTVRVTWCENIPPYVHIMYTNTFDSRVKFRIPRFTKQRAGTGAWGYELSRLAVLAPRGSGTAINGFYWAGDPGTGPYQWGIAEGYLMADGLVGGANRQGGGTTGGTGLSAGNKLIMVGFSNIGIDHQWVETSTVNYVYPNARFQVSSSTSILKFGQCSTDSEYSSWSAVGAGRGAMILMSSVSGTSTNAAELCPLFRSLGANGALRLDGGPSAGMVDNGVLFNPLTGFYSLRYGSARYIAYALNIGW